MKKKFIEKMEKMVDVFFSDAWQAKVFAMIFSIFGVICFIAGDFLTFCPDMEDCFLMARRC